MSRIETIDQEVKDAMKARDAERRDALRLILNALKNSEKELQRPLSEEEELQVLQRERKRRIEAAEGFRSGGREHHETRRHGVGYPIDETQDQRVRPLEILDPDDDRAPLGEGLEVASPRACEDFALLETRKRDDARIDRDANAVPDG